jgi:transposase
MSRAPRVRYSPDMTGPDLRKVAAVYSAAAGKGHAPTRAVEAYFGTSRSSAGRWVGAARAAGLLEPVSQGSSPRLNRKLAAVARALGVEPDALRDAVVRHADGELRVRKVRPRP